MKNIMNAAAYKFVDLGDAAHWRDTIRAEAAARSLKGTVLLASEGINLCLAGRAPELRGFLQGLAAHAEFAGLAVQESWSDTLPFGRLLVKVKREIIRMNRSPIRPQAARAGSVDAATLSRWLDAGHDDAGREIVMLDTRNTFEVGHGRFRGALHWPIDRFSDFPAALQANRTELDGKAVVAYCTGGIRCEKAALLMAQEGVADVLQLDGGILKYFEHNGGRHFDGNCFVFDRREALTDTLVPHAPV